MDTSPTTNMPAVPHTKARAPAVSDKRQRIGRKLQAALKSIIWEGQDIADAARAAGMTGHAVRIALARPHVIRWMKEERQVFLEHARAQNIHHAVRLRTCGNAMAELGAVKTIESMGKDEPSGAGARQMAPGLVILVGSGASLTTQQPRNAAKPLIEHELVSQVGPICNGTDSESEPT